VKVKQVKKLPKKISRKTHHQLWISKDLSKLSKKELFKRAKETFMFLAMDEILEGLHNE
jgi:hypothetical protein